jgi:hypothetical protein
VAGADHRFFVRADEEERSEIEPEGKGAIETDEIVAGLKAVMPMASIAWSMKWAIG